MLIRYKNQEKIAMGLLSFMPVEKDVKMLQQTMKNYEEDPNWHLLLWKEDDDIVGAIGLRLEDDISAVIQHISVNPSYRNTGIGKNMIAEEKRQFDKKNDDCSNKILQEFFDICTHLDDK